MLTYEHGSKKGVGSRLCVDIEDGHGGRNGRVRIDIYRQSNDEDTACAGAKKWEFADGNPATVALTAPQCAHILSVLRGEAKSILGGKGLVVAEDDRTAIVHIDAVSKPYDSFQLHIKTQWANGDKSEGRFLLNLTEALSLKTALESAMGRVAFGR